MRIAALLILLAVIDCKKAPSDQWAGKKFLTIAERGLILRSEPKQDSQPLGLIPFHSSITVIASDRYETIEHRDGQWLKTSYSGKEGYVFSGFLRADVPMHTVRSAASPGDPTLSFELIGPEEVKMRSCGDGYMYPACSVLVLKGGKVIRELPGVDALRWIDATHIIVTHGLGDCPGGFSEYRSVDAMAGNSIALWTYHYANPGCGVPNFQGPIEHNVCLGTRCYKILEYLKDRKLTIFSPSGQITRDYHKSFTVEGGPDRIDLIVDGQSTTIQDLDGPPATSSN